MNARIKNIYASLRKHKLDGFIVSSPANITYLTKYASRDSYLLVSVKRNVYFTDSRYTEEAGQGLKGVAEIEKINGSAFKLIAASCNRLRLKHIGFEERHLTFGEYYKIKENLARAAFVPVANLIEDPRQVKDAAELKQIRKAVEIAVYALKYIKKFIFPGRKEIEVAAELERFIRYQGAQGTAFSIIVASGPNSSRPHHISSQRVIKNNEPVLVDIGAEYNGYKSDLTRVYFLGKIISLYKEIYDIALYAQAQAIKEIRPGVDIKEIDGTARKFISKKGFGEFFGHALGHGIGLEVHERPGISGKSVSKLKAGMVFTVEPGIYLPGKFGARIEDMVLVTRKGCEVLSGSLNK